MINFVILWKGKAILHIASTICKHDVPTYQNGHGANRNQFFFAIKSKHLFTKNVCCRFKGSVDSLVANNKNPNNGLFTLVRGWWPWVICIGVIVGGCIGIFGTILKLCCPWVAVGFVIRQDMRATDRVL